MSYNKPFAEELETTEICNYGCGRVALFKFKSGKICCSRHYNSCPGKRSEFSNRTDHKETAAKSLATRKKLGITKSSRIKARETMLKNGTYELLRKKSQLAWARSPWQNNLQCPMIEYKNSGISYQGSFEFNFLEDLENKKGIEWIKENVKRGPGFWYIDPTDNVKRLYISDFLIYNTIYEIKSDWTWNKHGKDIMLEQKNKAKLNAAKEAGYNVILVLNKEYINA